MDYPEREFTPGQLAYLKRLARRLAGLRRSAAIDEDDLVGAAALRWWQFCLRNGATCACDSNDILFRQQCKFGMRDALRDSAPVKVTRTDQAKLRAYETPYTVTLDHAIDLSAGDLHDDHELWMDVVQALQQLDQRDQTIISLFVEHGYTFTEIAYAMDVSVSTVTRAYRKGLDTVKKKLLGIKQERKKRTNPTDV